MIDHVYVREAFADFGETAETLLFYPEVTLRVNEDSLRKLGQVAHPDRWVDFFAEHRTSIHLTRIYKALTRIFTDRGSYYKLDDEEEEWFEEKFRPFFYVFEQDGRLPFGDGWVAGYRDRLRPLIQRDGASSRIFDHLMQEPKLLRTAMVAANTKLSQRQGIALPPDPTFGLTVIPSYYGNDIVTSMPHDSPWIHPSTILFEATELPIWAPSCSEASVDLRRALAIEAVTTIGFNAPDATFPGNLTGFLDVTLELPRIADYINSLDAKKQWAEFENLYRRGVKFRDWVRKLPPDSDLLHEYVQTISRQKPFEKLPAKSGRWALFTGAGLALDALGAGGLGTATGVGLSLLNSFMIDRLIKGWRPGTYISHLNSRKRSK